VVSVLKAGLRGKTVPLDSEGVLIFTDKSQIDQSSLQTRNDYELEKKYDQECAGYNLEVSSRLRALLICTCTNPATGAVVLVPLFEYSSRLQKSPRIDLTPPSSFCWMWARWVSGESGVKLSEAQLVLRLRVILCYFVLFFVLEEIIVVAVVVIAILIVIGGV